MLEIVITKQELVATPSKPKEKNCKKKKAFSVPEAQVKREKDEEMNMQVVVE